MTFKTPIILLSVTAVLAGCAPGAVGNDNSRAQSGALTGALLGGAVGATTTKHNKLEKAAAGALLGGIVGGVIGNSLDKQAAELRQNIGNGNVSITNTGSELIVNMPQDILFAVDSATLSGSLTNELSAVAQSLLNYPNTTVQVIGHTDNTGSAPYNQQLSQSRANAVARVLQANGVPAGRIAAFGRGEDQPIASNLTDAGRAQNRRVEIIIRPNNV